MGAKVVLFIESIKLFDGKSLFDVDFVSFLKVRHKVNWSREIVVIRFSYPTRCGRVHNDTCQNPVEDWQA